MLALLICSAQGLVGTLVSSRSPSTADKDRRERSLTCPISSGRSTTPSGRSPYISAIADRRPATGIVQKLISI